MKRHKIIISGGGTGGHIFPALAIGSEIKQRYLESELLFVGAHNKMEMQQIPRAGFRIVGLWIDGFQRSLSLRNILFPFKLVISLIQSFFILVRFRPKAVVGTGGFASGALLQVAQWMRLPTLIQEQNSYPGITNKILGQNAKAICVGFQGMERFFPKEKIHYTGNPIRQNIAQFDISPTQAKQHLDLNLKKRTLAVLGGSLGARTINNLIAKKLHFIMNLGYQIVWQCGKLYYDQYASMENQMLKVIPFVTEMESFYAAADLIIARAGAGTIAELCCVGKPSILIPSPNVTANHQVKNAQALVDQQAAIMIEEIDLEKEFEKTFLDLVQDEKMQSEMGSKIRALAKPNATLEIVDELEKIILS